MKKPLVALLFVLQTAAPLRAATINVFFVSGQSNAVGSGLASDLPSSLQTPQEDVPYYFYQNYGATQTLTTLRPMIRTPYNEIRFGPEITFGRAMADYYATLGEKVAIIKCGFSGTSLWEDWVFDGTASSVGDGGNYTTFKNVANNGLSALAAANPSDTVELRGMIWMQGESDALELASIPPATNQDYAANFSRFIQDVRLTYNEPELPFVFGRLSSQQTAIAADKLNYLRSAQESVASSIADTVMVDTDSFGMGTDRLHFNSAGQQALGSAFATAMQAELVPEPSSAALAAAGLLTFLLRRRTGRSGCSFSPH